MPALYRLTAAVVLTALVAGLAVQSPARARATTSQSAERTAVPATVDAKIDGFPPADAEASGGLSGEAEGLYTGSAAGAGTIVDGFTPSAPVKTPIPFSLVGFDVPAGQGVQLRTSVDGRTWGDWQSVGPMDEGPDDQPATVDGTVPTSPAWVGPSTWLQIAADDPAQVVAHLIDSLGQSTDAGMSASPATAAPATAAPATPADGDYVAAAVARPPIISRAAWGADETITGGTTAAASAEHAVVHHTATTNDYSKEQAPGIVRSIQYYHAKTQGWSDIGYNFLIDRYGQIYEGRKGGVTQAIIGAHARGFNTGSIGVSLIGNFDLAAPTSAALQALRTLLAWKFDIHGIDPTATIDLVSGGSPKFASGTNVRLPAINAHRDTGLTSCPGKNLYAFLSELREQVESDMARGSAPGTDYARACLPEGDPNTGDVWRINGEDRVATAIAASRWYWRSGEVAVLAAARDFPDALSAGALAARHDAPLLLTDNERLSPTVAQRLSEMGAKQVFLMGGPASLSDRVAADVAALGMVPTRVAGRDRYATAASAASLAGVPSGEATLALGTHEVASRAWPDAVAAGALVSTPARMPTLLTKGHVLPPPTAEALQRLGVTTVWILGAEAAVSAHVEQTVRDLGITVRRLAGPTRYATSVAAAAEARKRLGGDQADLIMASGANYPDALAGAAVAARRNASLLLVPSCALEQSPQTADYLRTAGNQYGDGIMLGSSAAISERVRWQMGLLFPSSS